MTRKEASSETASIPDGSIRRSLLTSWRLWQFLLQPSDYPLFQRGLDRPINPLTTLWIVPLVGAFACGGTWALLIPLQASIITLLPLLLIALSSGYVSIWVMRISTVIVDERERGVYDQVAVTPLGAFGVSWVLGAATLHRGDMLGWITAGRKLLTGLIMLALAATFVTIAVRQDTAAPIQIGLLLLEMVAIAAVSYADHVQSVVLGSLAGMIAPTYMQHRTEAQFFAEALFLILQAIVGLAVFSIPTLVYPVIKRAGLTLDIDPLALSLALFYGLREGFIMALWHSLKHRLLLENGVQARIR